MIREFKPHVMTTYDENGGYPHPDHIRCHQVSVAAYEAAADYLLFPDAGEPWSVLKLYYNHGFLRQRMQLLQDEFAKHGQEGPFDKWLEHWDPDDDLFAKRVTTRDRVLEVLRPARRRAARPRHADRPEGRLLHRADRVAATALADRGIRAGPVAGAGQPARDRPVRGDRADMTDTADDRSSACSPTTAPRNTGPDFGKASPFGLLDRGAAADRHVPAGVVDEPAPASGCPSRSTGSSPEPDQAGDDGTVGTDPDPTSRKPSGDGTER